MKEILKSPGAEEQLPAEIQVCRVCVKHLPRGPKPVLRALASAVLMIMGQAPGRKVHETSIPWNDPSGDRLRRWLDLSREAFNDTARIAIIPTGFCYPGTGERGDLPSRPECTPLWHPQLRALLPAIRLTLLVGSHAQAFYLGTRRHSTLAETVQDGLDVSAGFPAAAASESAQPALVQTPSVV